MNCASCRNDNKEILWNEGGTFYCSKCYHRTSLEMGEDDLV